MFIQNEQSRCSGCRPLNGFGPFARLRSPCTSMWDTVNTSQGHNCEKRNRDCKRPPRSKPEPSERRRLFRAGWCGHDWQRELDLVFEVLRFRQVPLDLQRTGNRCGRIERLSQFRYRQGKHIAAFRDGPDRRVTEVFAKHRDISKEATVRDKGVRPDPFNQQLLMHKVPGIRGKNAQQVKFFRSQWDRLAATGQRSLRYLKDEVTEYVLKSLATLRFQVGLREKEAATVGKLKLGRDSSAD